MPQQTSTTDQPPHNRTPGTSDICVYESGSRSCNGVGVGELRGHHYIRFNGGIPWTMCREHIKPEYHPVDLRDKLVGWEITNVSQ